MRNPREGSRPQKIAPRAPREVTGRKAAPVTPSGRRLTPLEARKAQIAESAEVTALRRRVAELELAVARGLPQPAADLGEAPERPSADNTEPS